VLGQSRPSIPGRARAVEPKRTLYMYVGMRFGLVIEFEHNLAIGNESVPMQLAQCWFPGLAITNAKM